MSAEKEWKNSAEKTIEKVSDLDPCFLTLRISAARRNVYLAKETDGIDSPLYQHALDAYRKELEAGPYPIVDDCFLE